MNKKELINKLLNSKEGLTQQEYLQLIKYFFKVDNIKLKYSNYCYGSVCTYNEKIPFYSMDTEELKIYNNVIKACFIIG